MTSNILHRLAVALVGAWLAAMALPSAAKTMFYVPADYSTIGAFYVVLNTTDGKARLVNELGAKSGTFTDNGSEILVSLSKPLSFQYISNELDCNGNQYEQRRDTKQVLFRRDLATGMNKGKSRVVEIGEIVDIGGCTPGAKTPFGSVADEGYPMLHRSSGNREPMVDVVAGLTIAGFREPARTAPYTNPDADVAVMESGTTLRFINSNSLVNATLSSDQWLVLQLAGFERAYTRLSSNAGNGTETWLEAEWAGGKPQSVTNVLMVKTAPGVTFGTKAATSRIWESMIGLGSNNPNFVNLYRDFTGDRLQIDIAAATESRIPITWRYEGADVVTSRTTPGGMLIERRWMPLARTGKYMSVMEQEVRTPSGGDPFFYIPPRVVFYIDRGAAYPPAP